MYARILVSLVVCAVACWSGTALAQTPPAAPAEPDSYWSGSIGAGLALTRGNSDTTTFNLSFDGKYDPKTNVIVKAEGSYLRGATSGIATADRLALTGRGEWAKWPRAFAFGQIQYLRDPFKEIAPLVAMTAGIGYRIMEEELTTLVVDVGAGLAWEKTSVTDGRTSGAVSAGEKLTHKVSDTAAITQSGTALWKTSDFGDALYVLSVGVQAAVTPKSLLKVELQDTYKARPPLLVKSNDVALVASIIFRL